MDWRYIDWTDSYYSAHQIYLWSLFVQVLELTANNVDDLTALKSANLCSLLHLGLAQNQVVNILPRSFTPSKWYVTSKGMKDD